MGTDLGQTVQIPQEAWRARLHQRASNPCPLWQGLCAIGCGAATLLLAVLLGLVDRVERTFDQTHVKPRMTMRITGVFLRESCPRKLGVTWAEVWLLGFFF